MMPPVSELVTYAAEHRDGAKKCYRSSEVRGRKVALRCTETISGGRPGLQMASRVDSAKMERRAQCIQ